MRRVLLLILGFVACMALAGALDPRFRSIREKTNRSSSVMALIMGDSRQLLANHFFLKADAYFHYGTYPSIFEQARSEESHMTAHEADHDDKHEGEGGNDEHDHANQTGAASQEPHDWIQRFGRHFILNTHRHLEDGNEREILPWLKLSTDLDPHRITSYVTVAYWLRKKLNKPAEAEEFLRLGLRNNPDSYEILFELGLIHEDNNPVHARRLWELGLEKWDKQKAEGLKPDDLVRMELLGRLAKSESQSHHYDLAIAWLQKLKEISPSPKSIDKLIENVRVKASMSE